jgi:glc operon protein GlcG
MNATMDTKILTHQGAMAMLAAGVAAAEKIGQPQCIVIVDASGQIVAELRMTGAKFLSRKSAKAKALTAASIAAPSTNIPEAVRASIGSATSGFMTGLPGGLPIIVDGVVLGGVGVGSGTGAQDIAVGEAALSVIGATV